MKDLMGPPETPDTSDPFELLGVDPESDETDIKRAYVRLIKKHRPDKAPDEFKRIHAAYELALLISTSARWERIEGGCQEGDDATYEEDQDQPVVDDATCEEERYLPVVDVSDHAAVFQKELPGEVEEDPFEHRRRLLQEPADDGWARKVMEAFADDHHMAEAVLEECSSERIDLIVHSPLLSWPLLRHQEDRWAAAELLRARMEEALVEGRVEEAFREIGGTEYLADSIDNPVLEAVSCQVYCVLAWDRPKLAKKFFGEISSADIELDHLCTIYDTVTVVSRSLRRFCSSDDKPVIPDELVRFLEVGPVVDLHRFKTLAKKLHQKVRENPADHLALLDLMHDRCRHVIRFYESLLDGLCRMDEDEEDEEEEKEEEKEFSIPADKIADLRFSAEELTQEVKKKGLPLTKWSMFGGFIAITGAIMYLGWYAVLVSFGVILFLAIMDVLEDGILYRDLARARLLRILERIEEPLDRVVRFVRKNKEIRKHLGTFVFEMKGDRPLQVISLVYSLGKHLMDVEEEAVDG